LEPRGGPRGWREAPRHRTTPPDVIDAKAAVTLGGRETQTLRQRLVVIVERLVVEQ
jgi:hypothetical protein